MYFLELILSRACNQKCSYCTTYEKSKKFYADLDFIKQILDDIPKNAKMFLEINGGEVGLCKNLYDVVNLVKQRQNTKIRVMSNGLVRLNYPDIVNDPDVLYFEHLLEYPGKKFYDLEYFNENDKNNVTVFVVTEEFIDNFNYPINKNIWYKMVNIKSPRNEISNIDKFKDFYSRIKDKTYTNFTIQPIFESLRVQCSINPPTPFINIETKQIGHCAKILNESLLKEYSKDNLIKLLQSTLFSETPKYCLRCDDIAYNRVLNKLQSMKGKYKNHD